jgi:hypothetical protein
LNSPTRGRKRALLDAFGAGDAGNANTGGGYAGDDGQEEAFAAAEVAVAAEAAASVDDAAADAAGAARWWAVVVPEAVAAKVPAAGRAALLFVQPPGTGGSAFDAALVFLERTAAEAAFAAERSTRLLVPGVGVGLGVGRGRKLCVRRVVADNPQRPPRDLAIGCGGPTRGATRQLSISGNKSSGSSGSRSWGSISGSSGSSRNINSSPGSGSDSSGSDVMVVETAAGGNDMVVGAFPLDLVQARNALMLRG